MLIPNLITGYSKVKNRNVMIFSVIIDNVFHSKIGTCVLMINIAMKGRTDKKTT